MKTGPFLSRGSLSLRTALGERCLQFVRVLTFQTLGPFLTLFTPPAIKTQMAGGNATPFVARRLEETFPVIVVTALTPNYRTDLATPSVPSDDKKCRVSQ